MITFYGMFAQCFTDLQKITYIINLCTLVYFLQNRSPRQTYGNALKPVVSDNVLFSPKVMFDMYNPECPNCYRLPDMMRKQDNLYREVSVLFHFRS